jgi:hypothetical protein
MAIVLRKGKKRIISNNGHIQVDLTANRSLTYDGTKYRAVDGDKPDGQTKVQISNTGVNVLSLP